ncbi:MAG: hypothetical protein KJ579_02270 [Verrucomicrobia bacterium]|nr:hypothetical protein [Verrucomicrobiota bacterium]
MPPDLDEIEVANPYSGEAVHTIRGSGLFRELDAIVRFHANGRMVKHACMGSAIIRFKRKGEVFGAWGFAHGTFFFGDWATPATERRLADWFAAKGVKEFREWVGKDGSGSGLSFPIRKTANVRGLDYLASQQRGDGSWGGREGDTHETALALLAFLNFGETPGTSVAYGPCIERALEWLTRQTPTEDADRVSLVHALTVANALFRRPGVVAAVMRNRERIDPARLNEPTATLFRITAVPGSSTGCHSITNASMLRAAGSGHGSTSVRLYLESMAAFIEGGDVWQKYNREVLEPLLRTQVTDGSFPSPDIRSPVESTASVLMRQSLYYRFWTTTELRGLRTGAAEAK